MTLKENDIMVDMLRAPVNPADINKIQGMNVKHGCGSVLVHCGCATLLNNLQ